MQRRTGVLITNQKELVLKQNWAMPLKIFAVLVVDDVL